KYRGRSTLSRMVFDRSAVCVAAASFPPRDRRGIAMSDPSSSGTGKPGSSKKRTSPARNLIGLVVLVAVLAVAWLEFSAKRAYNAAVTALDARTQDENKGLLAVPEAENLLGKPADGPGSDFQDGNRVFTKKTYTWRGLLKPYTLTAFYTKGVEPGLHHFVTEGATDTPEPAAPAGTPT